MIIRAANYEDKEYDTCGNTTVAVLEIDNITIPLCNECLNELNESLSVFNNTIFCHKCEYFMESKCGWNYGGSCIKKAEKYGVTISEKNAGFDYCVNCMYTCEDATPKQE